MNLGLGEGELGRLTLGELAALKDAYWERQKREDWRAAMIVCAVVNANRTKEDGAISPADVMPWLREEQKAAPETKLSPEELRAIFEQLTLEMGGIVHPRNAPLAGA